MRATGANGIAWQYKAYYISLDISIASFPRFFPPQASLVYITNSPSFTSPPLSFKQCLRVLFLERRTTPLKQSFILSPTPTLKLSARQNPVNIPRRKSLLPPLNPRPYSRVGCAAAMACPCSSHSSSSSAWHSPSAHFWDIPPVVG